MTQEKITRRDMVRISGIGGAALLLSSCLPSRKTPSPVGGSILPTEGIPDIEIALTAAPDKIQILPGNKTTVWRYKGEVIK